MKPTKLLDILEFYYPSSELPPSFKIKSNKMKNKSLNLWFECDDEIPQPSNNFNDIKSLQKKYKNSQLKYKWVVVKGFCDDKYYILKIHKNDPRFGLDRYSKYKATRIIKNLNYKSELINLYDKTSKIRK